MSYAEAIDQLNALAPELHAAPGQPRRKFSLDEIGILLAALGNPQHRFPSVLIAGTNGKGSTAATLASILTVSGLRTGLYTSPHLARTNERIRLDRVEIGDEDFARIFFHVRDAARQLLEDGLLPQEPSYFEILTALALLYFAEKRVQIAILEVGMGGRLDATNIVEPLLSVITDISLDHMEWLGSTIGAIAREKAGILRRRGTLITLPQHPEAELALEVAIMELGVRRVSAEQYLPLAGNDVVGPYFVRTMGATIRVDSPLAGAHQRRNVALAIASVVELAAQGFPVMPANIVEGIRKTRWPGRLERIERDSVEWILDVAHNPAGAWALRASLVPLLTRAREEGRPRTLIFSCLRDKPIAEMAQILFPLFDRVILAPIRSARAAGMEELIDASEAAGVHATSTGSVEKAIQLIQEKTLRARMVVVSGSVYLVGEARSLLLGEGEVRP
jgi:dihydrofolate synthase/folylpolyglutamate synthase